MKFWIIVDNHHDGPHTADELAAHGLTPDTLVWCESLADWSPARYVPELMDALQRYNNGETVFEVCQPQSSDTEPAETAGGETVATVAPQPAETQPKWEPYSAVTAPTAAEPQRQPSAQCTMIADERTCPPSPLVWSIITTICCCMPVGVLGIIMSSMTKSAFARGDYQKAERYSNIAQWSVIAGITLGVMCIPFQMLMMSF